MKKLSPKQTASVQRPCYHRRSKRTETAKKEIAKKELSLVEQLAFDFSENIKKSEENETEASEGEEEEADLENDLANPIQNLNIDPRAPDSSRQN